MHGALPWRGRERRSRSRRDVGACGGVNVYPFESVFSSEQFGTGLTGARRRDCGANAGAAFRSANPATSAANGAAGVSDTGSERNATGASAGRTCAIRRASTGGASRNGSDSAGQGGGTDTAAAARRTGGCAENSGSTAASADRDPAADRTVGNDSGGALRAALDRQQRAD